MTAWVVTSTSEGIPQTYVGTPPPPAHRRRLGPVVVAKGAADEVGHALAVALARGHGRDGAGVEPPGQPVVGPLGPLLVRQPLGGVGFLVEPGEVEGLPAQQEVPAAPRLLGCLPHAAVEAAPVDRG